jgi:hypothetical protein
MYDIVLFSLAECSAFVSVDLQVCICKRRLTSVGSSFVLIFYLNFECVAALVPRAIILCI